MFTNTSLRRTGLVLLAGLCFSHAVGAQAPAPAAKPPADPNQVLYALGVAMAGQLQTFSLTEAEIAQVQRGLADGALKRGDAAKIDLRQMMPEIQRLGSERMAKLAAAETSASAAFLTQRAAEAGAVKTDSGLVFKEIKAGTGTSPSATDKVKVHYHGTLRTGEVFDSSVDRGEPVTLGLNQVVPCWTEALQKMKPGGKALITCPSKIAYGDQGRPPRIMPGATLSFEVELIAVEK